MPDALPDQLTALFTILSAPTYWLLNLPQALGYVVLGLLVAACIMAIGLMLARMRYSPLWSLLMLAPALPLVMLWVLAYRTWPVEKQR